MGIIVKYQDGKEEVFTDGDNWSNNDPLISIEDDDGETIAEVYSGFVRSIQFT